MQCKANDRASAARQAKRGGERTAKPKKSKYPSEGSKPCDPD